MGKGDRWGEMYNEGDVEDVQSGEDELLSEPNGGGLRRAVEGDVDAHGNGS
jgi:hypothetical protein